MTTIKLKNGSGAPLAGDLVQGEPALDLTNKRLYTEDSGGTVIEVGTNPTSVTTGTFTSTGIDDNAASTAITIDGSQNVGIGTNPDNKLHVYKGASGHSWSFDAGDAFIVENSDSVSINLATPSANSANILFSDADARGQGRIVYDHGSDYMGFHTAGVGNERMRIDSSGNVGIGTSSPSSPLHVNGNGKFNNIEFGGYLSPYGDDTYINMLGSGRIQFRTSGSEAMRIDSSGNLLVGTTDTDPSNNGTNSTADNGVAITAVGEVRSSKYLATADSGAVCLFNRTGTDGALVRLRRSGTTVGSISVTTSATSYNTSSDQRLKENIVDAPSASDDIDAIQVRSFDWKADGSHQKYGMVAQELNTVAPEAVSAPEDPEEMMGVDYSKLVPMLVKEIQSLRARVAQLEGAN